ETTTNFEELSADQYFKYRSDSVAELKITGHNPYPHKFHVSIQVDRFIELYSHIQCGEWLSETHSVAGRIYSKRNQGKSLIFYDLVSNGFKIQAMARADKSQDADFAKIHDILHRGDIVGFLGSPGRTKMGELSLMIHISTLLSPSLYVLPGMHYGVKDPNIRYRKRYLDLLMDKTVREKFSIRAKIINHIRNFLNNRDFVEVETPTLNLICGGASAKPFTTFHNQLSLDMFLRVAPELPLKMLIIGGFNRVYEIGKQFRNEGIDLTHNPEFTTCEFYMAYADYHDLMKITEEMLSSLVFNLFGSYKIKYHPNQTESGLGEEFEIDFTPPFRRIVLIEGLEEALGIKFPHFDDLSSDAAQTYFDKLCTVHNVDCSMPRTITRLLDKLVGEYLETDIINPAFIMDHPQVMSPLAKWHRSKPGFSERFELFVCKKELVNAYTELNDPKVQRELFALQAKDIDAGDEEAQVLDEDFCVALEH
ncbi:hypothetical protein MXB_4841, partial [Myxobolus squamalis]